MIPCPLCHAGVNNTPWHQDKCRTYLRCPECLLVFVPSHYHLSADAEKALYDQHDNTMDNPGYRRFLMRLFKPVTRRVKSGTQGLEFGCGPGPTLAVMFQEAGYHMALYDLYYADNPAVLKQTYDFITATEVVEHLAQPGHVIASLLSMLNNGGTLGLMTKLVKDREAFANWHYIRDLTHICFFSRTTFEWLAKQYMLKIDIIGQDVIILQSTPDAQLSIDMP